MDTEADCRQKFYSRFSSHAFSLKEDYDNLFSINMLSGVISMVKSQFSRNYDVIVEARDLGVLLDSDLK